MSEHFVDEESVVNDTNDALVASFLTLLKKDGVRQVANWRRPNSDSIFNENASAERFAAKIDSHFRFLTNSIRETNENSE